MLNVVQIKGYVFKRCAVDTLCEHVRTIRRSNGRIRQYYVFNHSTRTNEAEQAVTVVLVIRIRNRVNDFMISTVESRFETVICAIQSRNACCEPTAACIHYRVCATDVVAEHVIAVRYRRSARRHNCLKLIHGRNHVGNQGYGNGNRYRLFYLRCNHGDRIAFAMLRLIRFAQYKCGSVVAEVVSVISNRLYVIICVCAKIQACRFTNDNVLRLTKRYRLRNRSILLDTRKRGFTVCRRNVFRYVFNVRAFANRRRRITAVTKLCNARFCRLQDYVTVLERTHFTCAVQAPIGNICIAAEYGAYCSRYVNRYVLERTLSRTVVENNAVSKIRCTCRICQINRNVFKRCAYRYARQQISFAAVCRQARITKSNIFDNRARTDFTEITVLPPSRSVVELVSSTVNRTAETV